MNVAWEWRLFLNRILSLSEEDVAPAEGGVPHHVVLRRQEDGGLADWRDQGGGRARRAQKTKRWRRRRSTSKLKL